MNLFKRFKQRKKIKYLIKTDKDYNLGWNDQKKISDNREKINNDKYREIIYQKDTEISRLKDTINRMKAYINNELGEYITDYEMSIYSIKHNNKIKKIATDKQFQEIETKTDEVLSNSRLLRKKMYKVQRKFNKEVNKVL